MKEQRTMDHSNRIRGNSRLRAGHTYVVSQDGYSISFTYRKVDDRYVIASAIHRYGQLVRRPEAVHTKEDPAKSVYDDLDKSLSAEIKRLVSQTDYLSKESVISNVLRAGTSGVELERLVGKRESKGNTKGETPSYRLQDRYSYADGQQNRAERLHKETGPEPPIGDIRILPRDSLTFPAYNFIGKVEYEPPSDGSTSTARSLDELPMFKRAERKNPSMRPGTYALASHAYKEMTDGKGSQRHNAQVKRTS